MVQKIVSSRTYSREHASKAKEWRKGRTINRSIHDDREEGGREKKDLERRRRKER
jgi:hypothetical protein